MIKEYIFFINSETAFSLTQKKLVNIEDLKRKKVYGCFYSSNTQYRDKSMSDDNIIKEDIRREFKEQQNLNVLYKTVNIGSNKYIYIDQKNFIETLLTDYNLHMLVKVEQLFYKANANLINTNKTILVGILDSVHNVIVYCVYKNNTLISLVTSLKSLGLNFQKINKVIIKDIIEEIGQIYNVVIDDYVIYGYNHSYNEIIKAFDLVKYKETYNADFQDTKLITAKKTVLIAILIALIYPAFFFSKLFEN